MGTATTQEKEQKYLRLLVPASLHNKIVKKQAKHALGTGQKKSLENIALELLNDATKDIE